MYRKGDIVRCISEYSGVLVKNDETFEVLESSKHSIMIKPKNHQNTYAFNSNRFVLDIKETRKKKLLRCLR